MDLIFKQELRHKFARTLLIVSLLFLSALNLSAKDFDKLNSSISNTKNSIVEIFSYQCIHCFNHHKYKTLEKLKEENRNLHFDLYPVSLMNGPFGAKLNELFAYAKFTDEQSNKDAGDDDSLTHLLADAYFTSFFINKQNFANEDEFLQLGLKILKAEKSDVEQFLTSAYAKKILEFYAKANDIAKNTGTPAFIVNGLYLIRSEALTSLDNLDKIIKQIIQENQPK